MNLARTRARKPHSVLQRATGVVLVFLILSDIAYHIAAPFFEPAENYAGTAILPAHPAYEPEGGCPLPDGDGLPFHHHHYPAVISQTPPPVPLIMLAVADDSLSVEILYSPAVHPTGRAPPSSSEPIV
jgi:hypothetical protein